MTDLDKLFTDDTTVMLVDRIISTALWERAEANLYGEGGPTVTDISRRVLAALAKEAS
jgi:hypothetical protein